MSFEVLDKCKPLTLLLRECSCSGVLDVDVDTRGTCSVDGPAARSASMLWATLRVRGNGCVGGGLGGSSPPSPRVGNSLPASASWTPLWKLVRRLG